ncbi:MAG: hypothetical protein JKY28_00085 [Sulfurimonas sp.]|nr:hypothetical protein [Sulfurimonas sp.]PHQ92811.1 MAG: hypothetical protein COB42_00285 [Sulfurimonas sp.]
MNENINVSMRQCKKCHGNMYEVIQKTDEENYNHVDDKYTYYVCESCKHKVQIIKNSLKISNIISALFVGGFAFYFLFTGLFDFILYSFTLDFLQALVGIFLILVSLFFTLGPIWMLYNAYFQTTQEQEYKDITREEIKNKQTIQVKKDIYLALFLGLLPILFALGIGQIDYYIVALEKWTVYLLIPFVLSPLHFAKKLGSSWIHVFYGLLFWAILGLGIFFIFR